MTNEERQDALERARRRAEARDHPGVVDALSRLDPEDLVAEPECGFLLADARRHVGEADRALALVRALEPAIARRGNDRLGRDRLNLEGMLLFERGDIDGAERSWRALVDAANRAGDAEYEARGHNNLGAVFALHDRHREALASYERAIVAYQRLGYRRGLAQAHHNLGITYAELGYGREADTHLRRAIAYARDDGSEDEVARAEQERALLLLRRGDVGMAEATARRAMRQFESLGEPAGVGLARRVLGIAALVTADHGAARRHLEEALSIAARTKDALLEAETLEALAALDDVVGESDAAARARARTDELFAGLGAAQWASRIRARMRAYATDGRAALGLTPTAPASDSPGPSP